MALKVLKGRLNPDERPKRYNDILTAARTIESLMDPVLDSYARGTVGISNEEKQVCMDALRSPGGTVLMSCHANADGTYAISVSNEGPVIPASDAERIFDPFVRLSPDEHSLGIGLSLARRLAISMGYDLFLDQTYTKGVRFVVSGI